MNNEMIKKSLRGGFNADRVYLLVELAKEIVSDFTMLKFLDEDFKKNWNSEQERQEFECAWYDVEEKLSEIQEILRKYNDGDWNI